MKRHLQTSHMAECRSYVSQLENSRPPQAKSSKTEAQIAQEKKSQNRARADDRSEKRRKLDLHRCRIAKENKYLGVNRPPMLELREDAKIAYPPWVEPLDLDVDGATYKYLCGEGIGIMKESGVLTKDHVLQKLWGDDRFLVPVWSRNEKTKKTFVKFFDGIWDDIINHKYSFEREHLRNLIHEFWSRHQEWVKLGRTPRQFFADQTAFYAKMRQVIDAEVVKQHERFFARMMILKKRASSALITLVSRVTPSPNARTKTA